MQILINQDDKRLGREGYAEISTRPVNDGFEFIVEQYTKKDTHKRGHTSLIIATLSYANACDLIRSLGGTV